VRLFSAGAQAFLASAVRRGRYASMMHAAAFIDARPSRQGGMRRAQGAKLQQNAPTAIQTAMRRMNVMPSKATCNPWRTKVRAQRTHSGVSSSDSKSRPENMPKTNDTMPTEAKVSHEYSIALVSLAIL
jgi:hypothetical protein